MISRGLLGGTLGTAALNGSALVLNFVLVFVLSRALGTSGFGAYASAFAWAGVLSVVAVLGLTPLVIREVASYSSSASWSLLRGLLRQVNRAVAVSSALTVAGAAVAGLAIYGGRTQLLYPFLVALFLIPLIALTSVRQAAMQGLGRVVVGRLPETVIAPALFIGLAAMGYVAAGTRFTAVDAAGAQVAATLVAFMLGAWLLRRALPDPVRSSPAHYDTAAWGRSAAPLLALNVVMAANAQVGTIMLGALSAARDAGIFNVAFRVTTFISFVMLAAGYPLGPRIAKLYAEGQLASIEPTVVRAARYVLLVSAPVALVLVLFAGPVMSLFGNDFLGGATAIRILAVGDILNVLTGFGGLALVMCRRETDLMLSVAAGSFLNIGISAALIPPMGVEGAAIGAASGFAAINIVATWLAWRRLGVWAAVAGRPRNSPFAQSP